MKTLVTKIIDRLNGRGGFDDWWCSIEEDTQLEIIEELESINPWINVEDRLPEEIGFTSCIVVADRLSKNHVFEAMYNNKTKHFQDLDFNRIEVTHWQPLPEPPTK